jgi:hypothetical protein
VPVRPCPPRQPTSTCSPRRDRASHAPLVTAQRLQQSDFDGRAFKRQQRLGDRQPYVLGLGFVIKNHDQRFSGAFVAHFTQHTGG